MCTDPRLNSLADFLLLNGLIVGLACDADDTVRLDFKSCLHCCINKNTTVGLSSEDFYNPPIYQLDW